MLKLFIFTWFLMDFVVGNTVKEIKTCDTRKMLQDGFCPKSEHFQSKCVENNSQPNEFDGVCQCEQGFLFNPTYRNNSDYCIINTNPDDSKQLNSKSGRSSNSSYNSQSKNNSFVIDEPRIQSTPRPHHIVAGVLIPMAFVLIVIGSIFVYKKLHVTQRIRNIRRTHRNRPFYEDVMLGTNDNDDPPLI